MATFDFDRPNKWVIVDAPDTSATIQEIYNACKDYEDYPESMAFGDLCSAAGKADLGGSRFTVVTLTMLNGWKVKFRGSGRSYRRSLLYHRRESGR